jgi:3-deoxy-D-manno-octulosonic acid kinase
VARVADDTFVWRGEARSRPFAEWRLLAHIAALGLPAPRALAARYVRSGPFYRADIITLRIPDVVPLSSRLAACGVSEQLWMRVGACIARFHDAGIRHADLTAHNLQVDTQDRVFLLDFDRGRIEPEPGPWRERNLARLHRSLTKISRDGSVRFRPGDWEALLEGYRGGSQPA